MALVVPTYHQNFVGITAAEGRLSFLLSLGRAKHVKRENLGCCSEGRVQSRDNPLDKRLLQTSILLYSDLQFVLGLDAQKHEYIVIKAPVIGC